MSTPARQRDGQRPGQPGGHHRDRRGRGLRGRLVPATVPASRTRAQRFDDLVLDAVEPLRRRWPAELAEVEFAVDAVPPNMEAFDTDVLEDRSVPLARLLPGRPGEPGVAPRIVLYRRPLELRAVNRDDLAELVHDVVVEQVANLLGRDPEELDI